MSDALLDPQHIFGLPENVLSDPRLDSHAKMQILHRWRQNLQADGPEGEGMATMLGRVDRALESAGRKDGG